MYQNKFSLFWRKLSNTVLLISALSLTLLARGQNSAPSSVNTASSQNLPIISDWSMHHIVFSNHGTAEAALVKGTYNQWLKISRDPRYILQQRIRAFTATQAQPGTPLASATGVPSVSSSTPTSSSFVLSATPATNLRYPGGLLPRGLMHALIPLASPLPTSSNSVPASLNASSQQAPDNLQKDWSESLGVNGTVGLGEFPAFTIMGSSPSCTSDFTTYNTSVAGSSTQPSILAFRNLYSECIPRPALYWAYNTGGTVSTSVATSLDSTQLVFVQTDNTTGFADLVVLKWASGSGSLNSPTTLTSNSAYPNCTSPCMISMPLSGNSADSFSSVYVDYATGDAYVGDDAGKLHKFVNVFTSSTPTEATSPWPVTPNPSTGAALASPVYDSGSDNVFVGDYQIDSSLSCGSVGGSEDGLCGFLYSVNASTAAVTQSAQLDYNFGISDGPVVDSAAGSVYAFVGADNSANCFSGPCAAVFQFPVNFTSGASGSEATVGAGFEFLYSGNFDNQYYLSSGPPSGHLYVIGGTGPQNNTLYAITIDNGSMSSGSATAGPELATNYTNGYYAAGLPLSEFCNAGDGSPCSSSAGTDYLFTGVLAFGANFTTNPCTNQGESVGCIMSFTAPASGVIANSATPNGTLPEAGGPSGIIIDFSSNVYFSTLYNQTCATSGGTGGCAISATQSGLQ